MKTAAAMESIQDSSMETIERQELINYVKEELMCTIVSADAPTTIPVLITTFREDTDNDILQLARKLGYSSIAAMLHSKEFRPFIEPCYTNLAKGAGTGNNPEEVYAYRVKPMAEIQHILSLIGVSAKEKERIKQIEMIVKDPKSNMDILNGKLKLLECLQSIGGEEKPIGLLQLQNAYERTYAVALNKKELKNYFPTGHIKAVLDEYMYEDVQLFEDSTKSGSLFIQLAKPLAKIREEIDQIVAQHQELAKAEEEAKKQKKKAAKKPKEPVRIDPSKLVPLPKKQKVIVPPQLPKPKPEPVIRRMNLASKTFYSDDPELVTKIRLAHDPARFSNQWDEETEEDEEEEEEENEKSCHIEEAPMPTENVKKNKYTAAMDGAEMTDSEEEDDEDNSDDDTGFNYGTTWKRSSPTSIVTTQEELQKRVEERKEEKLPIPDKDRLPTAYQNYAKRLQVAMERKMKKLKKQQKQDQVAKYCERRAEIEALRREFTQIKLAQMAPQMATNKRTMIVDKRPQEHKYIIAALVNQFIWCNHRVGISEVEDMLKILFGDVFGNVQIDVVEFVGDYLKNVKIVPGPTELHLKIVHGHGFAGQLLKSTAYGIGKIGKNNWTKIVARTRKHRVVNLVPR